MHFFKGVSPWFLAKNGDFLMFSFYALWIQEQCLLEVTKEKKLFEAQKTSAQKTTKNCIFTKRSELERKEAFLKQKNIGSINHQTLHFFQRG